MLLSPRSVGRIDTTDLAIGSRTFREQSIANVGGPCDHESTGIVVVDGLG